MIIPGKIHAYKQTILSFFYINSRKNHEASGSMALQRDNRISEGTDSVNSEVLRPPIRQDVRQILASLRQNLYRRLALLFSHMKLCFQKLAIVHVPFPFQLLQGTRCR